MVASGIEGVPFTGPLAALFVLFVLQAVLFLMLRDPTAHETHEVKKSDRPLGHIVRQPVFIVAVLGGAVSYGIMTLIMTATPLSMHLNDGFSIEDVSRILDISPAQVKRDWTTARAFLLRELGDDAD